jgi:hypothetical protein
LPGKKETTLRIGSLFIFMYRDKSCRKFE